ncbi:MAG: Glyoxalase-like domain containing protein [Firmicutes bacterium]|nr:Glyoxalase-like domain containing protein [Bacillota bacterium]
MKIRRVDVTISTEKLQQSKEFYLKHFGFRLVFESDWYIELVSKTMPTMGISFTLPQREVGEFFNGKGTILSFEVDDIEAEYQRLSQEGLEIFQELQDKPWGERSFVINDPNGIHVYIYKSVAPTDEYKKIYDYYSSLPEQE